MKPSWEPPKEDREALDEISKSCGISLEIAAVLHNRGFTDYNEITGFLYPDFSGLHSPYCMSGIAEAVERIKAALDGDEKIAVFADSDLDGITSLAIQNDMLTRLGVSPVIRYPREKEGYGLTCDIIDEFVAEGVSLVITVDCGIRDIAEISYARDKGIDFIVTDHHEPDVSLPDAIIVNPKQADCSYPFKELAGVGVSFKLAQAVLCSYIPGFDIRYVLITRNNGVYEFAYVHRGLPDTTAEVKHNELVAYITENIQPDDFIIYFHEEKGLPELFRGIFSTIMIRSFSELAEEIVSCKRESVISELIEAFGIRQENCNSRIDLAVRLFTEFQLRSKTKIFPIIEEYLVLATIGTIADIMPLQGENRHIVKYGLSALSEGKGHAGVLALLGNSPVSSKAIGWDVAPVLNAPGRLGQTGLTVDFFLESSSEKLDELIKTIQRINRERRKLVTDAIAMIKEDMEEEKVSAEGSLFYYMNDSIRDGIAGLIANRMADELNKPVIIATGNGDDRFLKGSGRSPGDFNFFSHVVTASDMFERVGGHAQAFGFTAKRDMMESIIGHVRNSIGNDSFCVSSSLKIDCRLDIERISTSFIDSLSLLEPYGKDNNEPLFLAENVPVISFTSFGNGDRHGKYILKNSIQAIGWNMADTMNEFYNMKSGLDLVFRLENNSYMNRLYPRMILVDIDIHK